jgi:hypothetical protein
MKQMKPKQHWASTSPGEGSVKQVNFLKEKLSK